MEREGGEAGEPLNPYAASRALEEPELPAGHLARFAAFVIDLLLCFALVMGLMLGGRAILAPVANPELLNVYAWLGVLYFGLVPLAYHTLLEWSPLQASLGKLLMGLRVVHVETGERLDFGHAFLRATGRTGLSLVWISGLVVLVSPKRQGLWDMLASARVVTR